jgi:hypothetical protein
MLGRFGTVLAAGFAIGISCAARGDAQNAQAIDGISVDDERRELVLAIDQHKPWDAKALDDVDAKTRYYTTLMTSRQLEQAYPNIRGYRFVFVVNYSKAPTADVEARFALIRATLEEKHATLRWRPAP